MGLNTDILLKDLLKKFTDYLNGRSDILRSFYKLGI